MPGVVLSRTNDMIDEGYIKFESHWRKTGALEFAEIESLNRCDGRFTRRA